MANLLKSKLISVLKNSFFLALLLPCVASAEIVKCIDHGQVTYRNNSCSKEVQNIQDPVVKSAVQAPTNRSPIEQAKPIEPVIVNNIAPPSSLSVILKNGSYNVPGSVSGAPTIFQIDTGASKTAVSQRIADAAGISSYACQNRMDAATANGVVSVCLVNVQEITFGDFHVRDIQVIIMPNMQPEALLGMDILQHYTIEQRAGALKISY